MKITKRQLRRIIREETFDAKRDAMAQRGTYGAYKSRRPAKSSDYDFLKKDRQQQEKERLDALRDIDFDALKKKGRAILDVLSAGFKDNFAAAAAALGDKKSKFDSDEKRRLRAKEDLQFAHSATKTYEDFKPDRLERVMKYFDAYGFDSTILMQPISKQNEGKTTKKQLRSIIREVMGMADHPDQVDDAQYDRGYQDGLDGYPPADNATLDYDAGYEQGTNDLRDRMSRLS